MDQALDLNQRIKDEDDEELELSEENQDSVQSEEFNNLMSFYQNEFKGKSQGYSSRLPKCVNILLGEANRLYLEKNFDLAVDVCFEAIKVYPENPEPYHLLSVIYEEKGDMKRAVDFLFIETQLNYKSDINSWCKLADSFFKLESFKNAGYCYGRALKCEKNNVSLLFKKAQCYDKLKDVRGAIKYYEKICVLTNGMKGVLIKLAKLHSKLDQQQKAILLTLDYLAKDVVEIDFDVANVTCDLFLTKQLYRECCIFIETLILNPKGMETLQGFIKFFKNSRQSEEIQNDTEMLTEIFKNFQSEPPGKLSKEDLDFLKEETPADMLVNYCQSLLSLIKQERASQDPQDPQCAPPCGESQALSILSFIESLDISQYRDIFLDIVDIYSRYGYYSQAIRLCETLLASSQLDDRSVILVRMGFLYGKMGDSSREVEACSKALEINPHNKKARFRLSEIYEEKGLFDQALRVLSQKEGQFKGLKKGASFDSDEIYEGESLSQEQDQFEDDDEDEIYLSDDESKDKALGKRTDRPGNNQNFPALKIKKNESQVSRANPKGLNQDSSGPSGPKNHRVEKLIRDIKGENIENIKTLRRMVNIIELNEEFFINVQSTIYQLMTKFNLEILLLNFKQCELNLKNYHQEMMASGGNLKQDAFSLDGTLKTEHHLPSKINIDFKSIKKSLKLEQSKMALREKIYHLLLNESKGKIRSTFQGISQDDVDFKRDLNFLFIFKRKKNSDSESSRLDSMFKESKNKSKVAQNLSQKIVSKMKTIPDYITFPKFVEIIDSSLTLMYLQKKYILLDQICELLFKLAKIFDGYWAFQVNFYLHGFLANCKLERYEKAYVFFRVISKHLIRDEEKSLEEENLEKKQGSSLRWHKQQELKKAFKQKFKVCTQQDINNICFCMVNHLFNEFTNSNEYHRTFIQKFERQYEEGSATRYFSRAIPANNYIQNGSYSTARDCLLDLKDLDSNPLTNFLLGFVCLAESTNRNNDNKIESIHEAFAYLERYKELSPLDKLPEVYYNYGRAFSHLNMSSAALKMFAKSKTRTDSRLIEMRSFLHKKASETGQRVSQEKLQDLEQKIRQDNFYYEATFNEAVWLHKLGDKAGLGKLLRTGFN